MYRFVLTLILGCPLVVPVAAAERLDVESVAARNLGAVVLIYGRRIDTGAPVQGSGCVVHRDGYILATAHQAQGVEQFTAKFENGKTFPVTLVDSQPAVEYALFKAEAALPQIVSIGDASALRGGAPLVSIASPVNLEFTTVTGTVANPNKTYEGYGVLLVSLTATHGSSGGPVFDRDGRLIGLISGGLNEIDFTIVNKINNAYALLKKYRLFAPLTADGAAEDILVPAAGISEAELRAIEAYNRGVLAGTPGEKVEAYALAFTLLPQFYEACFNLAVAETQVGAVEQAVERYQRAATLRPEAIEVKRNLGRLYLAGKAYDEAISVFQLALHLAPSEAQSHNDLGEAYRRAGEPAAAIRSFTESLAINNNAPNVHYNLALTYANNKQSTEAIEHFKAYLALSPDATDGPEVARLIETLGTASE